ncbi:MAG: molybdopterin-dependent oxidoreductase [Anaerolineales bacterium]|nr:molybdopterin-dependent oxidoreductase [Anaerolineales bacterium]
MNLTVNGKPVQIEALPGETLADMLRKRLKLTGTKIGCEEAECGVCTVLVNGDPVVSCTYPAARADGKEILTIEGLAALAPPPAADAATPSPLPLGEGRGPEGGERALHPLQEAFITHGAIQCGFCTPGQIMTAHALLERNPEPTSEEIRYALKDTLCRCGGYPSIENAIQAAAQTLRTGEPLPEPKIDISAKPLYTVGDINIRPDAIEKANGMALYTDDLVFDGMLFGRVKRADIPHGILTRLDVDAARALPGVLAVLTAADIPGEKWHGIVVADWPVLVAVGERARYVGDAVAVVAAESEAIAEHALSLIEVEFKAQEVIDNPVRARQDDAPQLHEKGNLLKHIKVRKGNMDAGFAEADHIFEHTFYTQTTDHAFLEPECTVARPLENGRMEIYVGSQIPYADRSQVAATLGWPDERVRVRGQLMGGGFGGKEDIAGQIHAALLANATGKPVKLLFDRHESLMVHPKRHATQIHVKAGVMNDGRLLAVSTELYGDTGAYASLGEKVMGRATTHSSGPYDVAHMRADCYAMYTNNPPSGAFRGFGALQGQFAIENLMDRIAETLQIDPVEIRRKNALRVGSTTNTGQLLRESVGLDECIDKVDAEMRRLAKADGYESPFKPKVDSAESGKVRSWGFAVAYKNTGLGGGAPDKAGAEVELYSDGTLEVRTASAELGQGLVTVLQMVVAEEFALTPKNVKVLVMDTDLTPDGGPTTASRQTYVTGNAARYAAKTLREAIATSLAEKYDQPPDNIRFEEGLARVNGQQIPLGDAVEIMQAEGRQAKAMYEYWAPDTLPLGEGGDMHFAFSFAAQATEVEVDKRTGEVKVLRVIAANDVGKVINPLGLQGQIEGGVVMGVGHALTENFIVEQGIPFTDYLARYRMPNITQTPEIISFVVEHLTTDGPYGAKGVGEIVSIPTIPAITNAIYNAVGVRIDRLPVDQEEIVKGIGV